MTNPSWIGELFSSFTHQTNLEEYRNLNPALMETLFCTYKSSYVLQTLIGKLQKETLRGGVLVGQITASTKRHGTGNAGFGDMQRIPVTKGKGKGKKGGIGSGKSDGDTRDKIDLSPGAHARLLKALKRAILYGFLFGLVPVMSDPEQRNSIQVPPITSGCFVGRMSPRGKVDVGWRWKEDGLQSDASGPDPNVWVFVWEDREPIIGSSAPFSSVIQPLLPELFRERELVEDDTQAHHELSQPSMVLQENPRNKNDDAESRRIVEYIVDDVLNDPYGYGAGHGPGGTLSRQQKQFGRQDLGAAIRARQAESRGLNGYRGETERIQLDPCTGEVVVVNRTTSWQRGSYVAPAGLMPTAGYARPNLRADLLAQREHVTHAVAAALGVPVSIAFTGHISNPNTRRRGGSTTASYQNRSGQGGGSMESDACSAMRDTIASVRAELSDLFGQAHFHLIWRGEAVWLSRDVVLAEQMIEEDTDSTQAMARQLELMGSGLRREWQNRRNKRLRDTVATHRAVAIADQAQKLWKDALIHQRVTALLGIVSGTDHGSVGFPDGMSLEEVHRRQREGEGMPPVAPGLLRDVDDDGDVAAPPRQTRSIDEQLIAEEEEEMRRDPDPNTLAEYAREREERTRAEGNDVSGHTQMLVAEGTPHTRYERRALTEEPPRFEEILARATALVDARLDRMESVARMRDRLSAASGEKGDSKVELIWRVPPLPDWGLLRELTMDGVVNARMFQSMYLSHLGFNPTTMPGVLTDTDPFGAKSPRLRAILIGKTKAPAAAPKPTKKKVDNKRKRATETTTSDKDKEKDKGSPQKKKPRKEKQGE